MRNIGAVILAAGGSSRFGRPKQLIRFCGETLVRRAVCAATEARCNPIVVVAGEMGDAIGEELSATRAVVVQNTEWQRGIGTSIRRGLQEMATSIDAVVLLTCDQPLVDGGVIARLIVAQDKTGQRIIAASYANTLGIPALFDRSCFQELLMLPDDSGAKPLIRARPDDVGSIAFEEGAVDIDTPQDFERLKHNRG